MKKKLWISIAVIAVVLTVVTAGLLLYKNQQMIQLRNEALEELVRNAGQYDEQSIVLYETSKAKAEELAELYGAQLRITKNGRFATLSLPEGTTIRDVFAMEESLQYIDDMAPDYQVKVSELTQEEETSGEKLPTRPQYSVSDKDYELQTYLDYLNMGSVWNQYTGYGVTVAVIDTGIDTDHPEFAGRISEYSYNATEDKIVKDYLLEDGSYDWSLIEDEQGHGTAVTGVLAASMNSGNIVGIAPDVNIIVIKAECDENGNFYRTSDLVYGLYYAIERDVQVVNMSFGTYSTINPFEAATQLAYDSDIICIAAAGNDATSRLAWPAADERVIGVGALGENWNLARYSNFGENTDVVAPGSTYTSLIGGSYGLMQGTSLASPVVAGAIALLMQNNVYMTYEEVTEILYAACYDLGDLGRDWYYGFGALDISALVIEQRGTIHYDMLTDEVENIEGLFIQGHTLQQYPEPERLYAVFDGWYYDDTFTQACNYYEDKFYGEVTLYAKWINEDDGVPFTYVVLEDDTIEIRSYTGHRRYITVPAMIEGKVVSSIGDFAFENQTRLREVTLPDSITNIGSYAFSGCTNLISISIPEAVTQIRDYAFYNNTRLRTIAFRGNSNLQSIGDAAFAYSGLDTIELPAKVNRMNGSAFMGATNLYEIKVQSGNTAFTSQDGILFNLDGSALVAFPAAWGTSYGIPSGTTRIEAYAFAYAKLAEIDLSGITTIGKSAFVCASLRTVTIPDSVTTMEEEAFKLNMNLTRLTIGSGLQQISKAAFMGTTSLQTVTIPAWIEAIGESAFSDSALEQITFASDSKLQFIGPGAFYNGNIREIDIPASVVTIGEGAFSGQILGNPLVRVGFAENSALERIEGYAFAKCWLLDTISLPDNLKSIGGCAFQNTALTQVTIPASVTELGDGAFSLCYSLTAVTIETDNTAYHDLDGVVYTLDNTVLHTYPAAKTATEYTVETATQMVNPWAFAGVIHLNTAYLPEGLTEIGDHAFSYSEGMAELRIPDNVIHIGKYVFAESWNLSSIRFGDDSKLPRIGYGTFAYCGIYNIRIPANVSTIAQDAFRGCDRLSDVYFAENSKLESISAYMFDGCSSLYSITFMPGSALTSIQAHGLEGMKTLTILDFGDAKITNVDNFAFRFCESLTTLNLPDTVTNIGRYAFYGCNNLSELTIPETVEYIGSYAFLKTGDIQLYFTGENLPAYLDENWDHGTRGYYTGVVSVEEAGDYKYAILESGNIAILEYLGSDATVDLSQLDLGTNITTIGGSAFEGSSITSIVLPDTLTQIQAEAFLNASLQSVTIPASVTFIGREAFAYTDLTSLSFAPGSQLSVMEQYAFEGTKKLTSVTLPASLTTMGTGVFLESGLQSVTFENGIQITEIPQKAFANTKLTEVILPDSVMLVNHNAFNNVQTLKRVTFGNHDGIRLMSNAFYHTGLEQLHIPANVTYIGEYCFVALSNLTEFTVDAENPNYKAEDGLLLNKSGRKLIAVPAARTGTLTVPASVEEIGFGAFEESKLTQVHFQPDTNILTFGYRAFFKASITQINIPKSVVSIDYYAFAYCEDLTTVTFAEGNLLKGIYEGAFLGCTNLENITVPDAIVEISDFAFYGCSKIDEIPVADDSVLKGIYDYAFAYTGLGGDFTTPETLVDIGDYAFLGCGFTKLTIPETNKRDLVIGLGAFGDCNQLTEVTLPFVGASFEDEQISWFGYIFGAGGYKSNNLYLPASLQYVTITEGVQNLYPGAFYDVDTPAKLYLPESISTIWPDAFVNTGTLFELLSPISVANTHTDGIIWDFFFENSGIQGEVTLANGMDSVPNFMFSGCWYLTKVNLPESIKMIGIAAFQTTGLTDINLPEGLTVIEMGAFSGTSLKTITLPSTLTAIGDYAFSGCMQLKKVINNSSLDIVPGSESHGGVALYATTVVSGDDDITTDDGNVYVETEDGFVFRKDGTEYVLVSYTGKESVVTLPTQINGKSYTIERFKGADHVIIPGDLKTIGYQAFAESDALTVQICEGITEIGYQAFSGAKNLISVVLPESLTAIGDEAFSWCVALESIHIPENVKTMGYNVFDGCEILKITVDSDNPNFTEQGGVLYDAAVTQMLYAPYDLTAIEIPKTVTYFSLKGHTKLRTVTFEVGSVLTEVPMNAFFACDVLETVVLPDGVQKIGGSAFTQCNNLKEINIPDSVREIEGNPFRWCGIENLIISPDHAYFTLMDGVLYDQSVTTLVAVLAGVTEMTIPATVTTLGQDACGEHQQLCKVDFEEGSQLAEIPSFAFMCESLQTITLPENLVSIADGAFNKIQTIYNRSQLELTFGSWEHGGVASQAMKIVEADGSVRYNLPEGAFMTDDGFVFSYVDGQYAMLAYVGDQETVTLPLTVNGEPYTMWGVTGFVNVIIPEGFTWIDNLAFWNCKTLRSVVIPDTVTVIVGGAFQGCSALTSVVIPESVEYLGGSTFEGCTSLKDITLPDHVRLGEYDFYNTGYINDPDNWVDGCCYLGKHLIRVGSDVTRVVLREDTVNVSDCAFYEAYKLEYLDLGNVPHANLRDCMNLVTLVLGLASENPVGSFFAYSSVPLTLKNVVLKEGFVPGQWTFENLFNITIYVEETKEDTQWEANYPGWSNGNKVAYGDHWIWVNFYDTEGNYYQCEPKRTSEVIRRPVIEVPDAFGCYRYVLGWDLDGDGQPDNIPATSAVDIHATAVLVVMEGHAFGQWVTVQSATCTMEGLQQRDCVDCGHSDTRVIVATGHTDSTQVVAPTCTEQGYTIHTCTVCNESYVDSYVDALGHTLVHHEAQAPSCTEPGWEAYDTCAHCDYTTYAQLEATGHSYDEGVVTSEPTCTELGVMTYTCTGCGHSYTEEIPEVPHHFEDGACTECGAPEALPGDINGDGWVDVEDAMLILQMEAMLIEEDGLDLSAADVNGDGWVDVEDAMLILQFDALLIDKFPVEE